MARTRFAAAALAASLSLSLGWAGSVLAQDPPKDDALDRLLEKLEGNTPAPSGEAAPKPKKDEAKKDAPKEAPKDKERAKPKPATETEPQDKALDSLLEKLGETKEAPKTTGPAGDGAKPENPNLPGGRPQPEDKTADKLKEGQKPLDEHLEELTGRVKKKKNSQGQQEGQPGQQGQEGGDADDSSPLGQAVKKMRHVEGKLGETDTGEGTRKTQGEIIKDLDTLIAQAKKSGQPGSGKPRKGNKPGQQPGQQQGEQPGSQPNAQGAGPMKTAKPNNASAHVGDKNTWGNLPPMLRDEMENVFRAEMLPKKSKQISRYYESINKKSLSPSRGE